MNKHKLPFSFLFVLFLFIQGCATTLQISPLASEDQEAIYQDGVQTLISKKKALVAVRPSATTCTSDERPTFVVSVFNGIDEPFDFSTENIQVEVNGVTQKVFTYDELVAEVKNAQAWQAVAVALGAMAQSMNAANAGTQYHTGSYNSNTYGSGSIYSPSYTSYNYSGSTHGTYSGVTYNPAAAQQAQAAVNAQTTQQMEMIRNQTEQALNNLGSTILKKNTVFPKSWHGGYVTVDKTKVPEFKNEIKVTVNVLDEDHVFNFKQVKMK